MQEVGFNGFMEGPNSMEGCGQLLRSRRVGRGIQGRREESNFLSGPEVIIQVDLSKGNFFYRCIGLNIRVVTSTHTKKGNTTEKVFSYSIHNM